MPWHSHSVAPWDRGEVRFTRLRPKTGDIGGLCRHSPVIPSEVEESRSGTLS
jgi:hypothetical protein